MIYLTFIMFHPAYVNVLIIVSVKELQTKMWLENIKWKISHVLSGKQNLKTKKLISC